MFVIIGIIVVIGSVLGGYMMHGGNLHVLIQPSEFVIIVGAAIGGFIISSPKSLIFKVIKSFGKILSSSSKTKEEYIEILSLLYQLFSKIRKEGLISVEADIENPNNSPIFEKYSSVIKDHHLLNFICDNLKVIITSNIPPHELESLMDLEIEVNHHEAMKPSHSIAKIADALPGLGIVAAVLGVVITMGKVDQPPAILGKSVGAALVGTFLGVLLCYGFVGPMATNLEHKTNEEEVIFQVVKVAIVAFVGGAAPQMAVEFGRRAIPGENRPTFNELEVAVRGKK